jgi:hypothetical protein
MPNYEIQTRADYDAVPGALNFTRLKELLKCPAAYKLSLETPREETKALRLGIMAHMATLEAERFLATYAVALKTDKRTKEGKAAAEAFAASLKPGQIAADPDEYELAVNLSRKFTELAKGVGAMPFVKTEYMFAVEYNGIQFKAAIDAISEDGYAYDLKTAESASPRDFTSSIFKYKYALQAVIYRTLYEAFTGERLRGFRIIAVEKDTLLGAVYEIGPELTTRALMDFEDAMRVYKECLATDTWPGYAPDPTVPVVLDVDAKPVAAAPINFA